MRCYDDLARLGVLVVVGHSDAGAFGYLVVDRGNLVTELSSMDHDEHLGSRILSIHSKGRADSKGTSLTSSVLGLCDQSIERLLDDEWNRHALDDGGLLEAELIDDVVQQVLRNVEVVLVFPDLRLRDERLSHVLGELVLDQFNHALLAFLLFG